MTFTCLLELPVRIAIDPEKILLGLKCLTERSGKTDNAGTNNIGKHNICPMGTISGPKETNEQSGETDNARTIDRSFTVLTLYITLKKIQAIQLYLNFYVTVD